MVPLIQLLSLCLIYSVFSSLFLMGALSFYGCFSSENNKTGRELLGVLKKEEWLHSEGHTMFKSLL